MPYLSGAQRNLLAPAGEDHPRDGETVPTSDQATFVNSACWGWALTGEHENANNAYTAATIYNSDEGAFVFDDDRVPTGLNADFFNTTNIIFPQTAPFHQVLVANLQAALDGDSGAQDTCRVALMTCDVMWDEDQPLETVLRIDGLLQAQVNMLNNVV